MAWAAASTVPPAFPSRPDKGCAGYLLPALAAELVQLPATSSWPRGVRHPAPWAPVDPHRHCGGGPVAEGSSPARPAQGNVTGLAVLATRRSRANARLLCSRPHGRTRSRCPGLTGRLILPARDAARALGLALLLSAETATEIQRVRRDDYRRRRSAVCLDIRERPSPPPLSLSWRPSTTRRCMPPDLWGRGPRPGPSLTALFRQATPA
jgi:hypothetical protein